MSSIAKSFNDGLAALNNRDLKRAEELFKRVLRSDRSHVPTLNLLVVVLMSMDRFAEAEPLIARATSINQQSDMSFYNYGLISKRLNKPQQALENFGRALALNPAIVLFEHSSATLPRAEVAGFARELLALVEKREAVSIALTMDAEFAGAVSAKTLTLDAATGRVSETRPHRFKFWS